MKRYALIEGDRRPVHAQRWTPPAEGMADPIAAVFGDHLTLIPARTHDQRVLLVRPVIGGGAPSACFPGDWIVRTRAGALSVVPAARFDKLYQEFE